MPTDERTLLVEGGGSHTRVILVDGRGVLCYKNFPSLNQIGAAQAVQIAVVQDIGRLAHDHGTVAAALFALGAALMNEYLHDLGALLRQHLPTPVLPIGSTYVTNDLVPLLFAEPASCDQMVVVSGTGSTVVARRGFQTIARCGAHEYLLGDDGSGYDIGRHGIRAVIASLENRGSSTALVELVAERTGGIDIRRFVYGSPDPKRTIAEFALDVFAADRAGDPVAGEILTRAAARLAAICRASLTAIGSPSSVRVTLTGTLLTEPTGRFRSLLAHELSEVGATTYQHRSVDVDLLLRTLHGFRSETTMLATISREVPAAAL